MSSNPWQRHEPVAVESCIKEEDQFWQTTSDSLTTTMRIALLSSLVTLACAQQAIQPASTQLLQFIDQNGASIPVRPVGQQQQFQISPQQQQFIPQQQQQFIPQQQQFIPQQQQFIPQQQQRLIPQQQRLVPQQQRLVPQQQRLVPQQQRLVPQQQQQRFAPQPQQFVPQQQQQQASPFQATPSQVGAHQTFARQQQQQIQLQREQFSPAQIQAQKEFDNRPPPEFLPLDHMTQLSIAPQQAAPLPQRRPAPQQQRRPAPAPQQQRRPAPQQQRRPAPQQQRRPAAAPQQQIQEFSQFPAQGAAPQQRRPAQQQRRPSPQRQAVQAEPGSVNDNLGQVIVESEQYVHDPSGDDTLSRFQLFQLRKKQEAQTAAQA